MKRLETERLILREWRESDIKDLFEYASNELVGPNAGWSAHKTETESREIVNMFIEGKEVYAIELKSEKKVIGSIGLHDGCPDSEFKELKQKKIGFALNPKHWGNGYAPEATNRVIKYGFEGLDLDIIWCGHFDFNERSKSVINKCEFIYKFTIKEKMMLLDNKEFNLLYYKLSKDDYENKLRNIKLN